MATVSVAFTPLLYANYAHPEAIVVVIDVLRATSAISAAFASGVESIIPVESLDEAKKYKQDGFLVGAERNGEKIPGFDFGNSPYDYMREDLHGQTIVLTTTNGTRAFNMARDSYMVLSGSFINVTALSDWLGKQDRDIVILCSGWKDKFNLEDSMCAGAIVNSLFKYEQYSEFSDSSLASRYLYEVAKDDTFKFLRNSSHRKRMKKLNMKEDIRYSLTPDKSDVIPILKDGRLVPLNP